MKYSKYIITSTVILTVLIISAGCITDNNPVNAVETGIPVEMQHALNELSSDISLIERSIMTDLNRLSSEISAGGDNKNIRQIISGYYSKNPYLTTVIYYNIESREYISVPVFVDVDFSSYSVNYTEDDFKNSGGLIVRNNVFTAHHGYQNLYYKPVYNSDSSYQGYLIFVTDSYSLLNLHPLMINKENTYGSYICFITDENGEIICSSITEAVGKVVSEGKGFYDNLAYIPDIESGDGACKYTSRGFYIYDEEILTEKITAWHTIYSSHGKKYYIYLITELNQPELKTENIFEIKAVQVLNDTLGAYIYSSTFGMEKLIERIKSGYYETPMNIMNMKGTVIVSSDEKREGRNFLNAKGVYGASFVEFATIAAEQGGGYIYYLTPAELVLSPRAAQYTIGIITPLNDYSYIYTTFIGDADAVIMNKNHRTAITMLSHKILEEVYNYGVEEVAEIINSNGINSPDIFIPDLVSDVSDIAILDVDGYVYASIEHPELVGKSATFMTDAYGGSITRRATILAKTGGGYMPQMIKDPDNKGYVILSGAKIEPIDDKYFIYTSAARKQTEDVLTPSLEISKPTE